MEAPHDIQIHHTPRRTSARADRLVESVRAHRELVATLREQGRAADLLALLPARADYMMAQTERLVEQTAAAFEARREVEHTLTRGAP